jgi:hypothetical protein
VSTKPGKKVTSNGNQLSGTVDTWTTHFSSIFIHQSA